MKKIISKFYIITLVALLVVSGSFFKAEAVSSYSPGVTVVEDNNSPSGYTAYFVYNPYNDLKLNLQEGETVTRVEVVGSFRLLSGDAPMSENSDHGLDTYVNGDYCANVHPRTREVGTGIWGYQWPFDMTSTDATSYTLAIPMISGAHQYSYRVTITSAANVTRVVTTDDPKNPSPCRLNEANSNSLTSDINSSIVYGKWHSVKQSKSPNLDYLNPTVGSSGTLQYVTYEGTLANNQDLGIYLPPNYNPNREEPYKVIYLSHGAGGNETYWYAMGQANNSMDHIIEKDPSQEAIVVSMDNTLYNWDYYRIAQNVLTKIIPYIEANYNVSKEVNDRAFCGFSMGSMTTTYMAFHYPGEFGYFGILSGCNIKNATFKEGFEYDSTKFNTDTNYLQEVYANIQPSKDLLNSVIFTMAGTSDTALYANGFGRYGAYETIRDWCLANMPAENYIDGGLVPGSHDLYTWGQCFYTFAKDIVWSKDVPNPELKQQTITSTDKKISVSGILPDGLTLVVKPYDLATLKGKIKNENITSNYDLLAGYNIYLVDSKGNEYTPISPVTVEIEMEDSVKEKAVTMLHITNDGDGEILASEIIANKISFKTSHFSDYAIASLKEKKSTVSNVVKTGDNSIITTYGVLSLFAIGIFVTLRKKKILKN